MLTLTNLLLAEDTTVDLNPKGEFAALKSITIPNIISAALRFTLVVAAIVFFFMLVIGGIRWILSGGDKASTEAARNQITAALIGLVIIFAAWAIAMLLKSFFGVDIFTLVIPSATTAQ